MPPAKKQIKRNSNQESPLIITLKDPSTKPLFPELSTRELRKLHDETYAEIESFTPKSASLIGDQMKKGISERPDNPQEMIDSLTQAMFLEKKLLKFIANTRGIFFKDHENAVFDSHTGVLWPYWLYLLIEPFPEPRKEQRCLKFLNCPSTINGVPFHDIKRVKEGYSDVKYISVENFLKSLNVTDISEIEIGGFDNWEIPSLSMFDTLFPSPKALHRFQTLEYPDELSEAFSKSFEVIFVHLNRLYSFSLSKYLGRDKKPKEDTIHSFSQDSFFCPINRSFQNLFFFSKKTKTRSKMILDLFYQNNLLPITDHKEYANLFHLYFKLRPISEALLSRRSNLNSFQLEIGEFHPGFRISWSNFLDNKRITVADTSVIQFCQEAQVWFRLLLAKLEWVLKSAEKQLLLIHQNLSALQNETLPPQGIPELEALLENRRTSLHDRLSFGASHLRNHLNRYLEEILSLERKALQAAESDKQISALVEVEHTPRPAFKTLVDQTTAFVNKGFEQIDWVIANQNVIQRMLELHQIWREDVLTFCRNGKNALLPLTKEGVESALIDKWFDEWKNRRVSIEALLLPIFDGSMAGTVSLTSLNSASEMLQKMKEEIDGFYSQERAKIHRKIFNEGGKSMEENLASEYGLFSIRETFESAIEDLIFSLENNDERLFLLRWGKSFFSSNLESICHLAEVLTPGNEGSPLKEIIRQFRELEKSNLEVAIRDAQAFAQILKDRKNHLHSLLFQMKKALTPSVTVTKKP